MMPLTPQPEIFALQMYDRVAILADLIMEYLTEANAIPPKELIDAYYDAVEDASHSLNVPSHLRLHEQVVRPNGSFYEEIHAKFGLENVKKPLDKTPDLF